MANKDWEVLDAVQSMNDPYWQPTTVLGTMAKDMSVSGSGYLSPSSYSPSVPSRGSSGGGLLDGVAHLVGGLARWFLEHIWPLKYIEKFGIRLADGVWKWKHNLPFALAGLFLAPGVLLTADAPWVAVGTFIEGFAGTYTPLVVLSLGAVAGWLTLPALGMLLAVTIWLLVLGLSLATISAACYVAWRLLQMWLASS